MVGIFLALALAALVGVAGGQQTPWGLGAINPVGEAFRPGYAAPVLHRWYEPRHLPETYMDPWYGAGTNYARHAYARYVSRLLEGQEAYDIFGQPLGRGWLVYNWRQEQPGPRGSLIDKRGGGLSTQRLAGSARSAYRDFFDRLVIASEQSGERSLRLMLGDEIYTFFTPLTFYKPRFNGVRLDGAAENWTGTLIMSRPSNPDEGAQSNATSLMGGRARWSAGEQASFGLSYVNAHNVLTQVEFQAGNPLRGILTTRQNQPLDKLWVRVRDDSPGRGRAGAVLAGFEVVLVDTSGRQWRGREIGLLPAVQGGVSEGGQVVARDAESILLEYDLGGLDTLGLRAGALQQVRVELSVANDYRIEVASDLQTDGQRTNPEIVFMPVHRARGNVQDHSNTRVVEVDYGLPVAREIWGVDMRVADWRGLSLQGELALSRAFRRYPNPHIDRHHQRAQTRPAAYAQAAYRRWPWTLFAEVFSIDEAYSTSYWLTDADGRIRYKAPIPQVYEFVDDDDDLNGLTEWQRPFFARWGGLGGLSQRSVRDEQREIAWPGYDENGDFLNDHNQNDNLFPDYEEPFLRFRSDRPEFLFGLDMNHNGTIDRFENDNLPDYPYRNDHRGYNAYAMVEVMPGLELTAGRQDMGLMAGDGRTEAWYGLASWERSLARGRARLFVHGARVRDDIADDLRQWFQPLGAPGRMRDLVDLLPAHDAWKGLLYADVEHVLGPGVRLEHRFKGEGLRQVGAGAALERREGRRESYFLGLVDRAEWRIPLGLAVLEPRWKSELRRERPFNRRLSPSTSAEQILILLWTQPLLAEQVGVTYFPRYGRQLFATELQVGLELSRFWLLQGSREEAGEDFGAWTAIAQLSNRTAYQGYQLVARTGVQFTRRHFERRGDQSASLVFLTVNAGLGL